MSKEGVDIIRCMKCKVEFLGWRLAKAWTCPKCGKSPGSRLGNDKRWKMTSERTSYVPHGCLYLWGEEEEVDG